MLGDYFFQHAIDFGALLRTVEKGLPLHASVLGINPEEPQTIFGSCRARWHPLNVAEQKCWCKTSVHTGKTFIENRPPIPDEIPP